MTAHDLEQALAATLHRHAEEAMIHTDTRTEHERLDQRLAREQDSRGRRVVIGGALVAAAAAVAAAVWVTDLASDRTSTEPVRPSTERTAAEEVADGFFEAYAAGDSRLAASYVAPGSLDWDEWRTRMHGNVAAWHVKYDLQPCEQLSTSPSGASVVCGYSYYSLGSDELGYEPFANNTLELRVADGKVVTAELTDNSNNNGESELFDAIGAWVRQNHPSDWAFLSDFGPHPGEMDRWYQLWDRRIDEYVADRTGS